MAKSALWFGKTNALKRVQRYLGLRPKGQAVLHQDKDIYVASWKSGFEDEVIFIAIDLEAVECTKDITEVGISYLDSRDVKGVRPGRDLKQWFEKIRSRHFIVGSEEDTNAKRARSGHKDGDPSKFSFGCSDFVTHAEMKRELRRLFEEPFGRRSGAIKNGRRNLVFLAHAKESELRFLSALDFDPREHGRVIDVVDSQDMDNALHRLDITSNRATRRKLKHVLEDEGISSTELHNAGNDAYYTMCAAISIAFRAAVDGEVDADSPQNAMWRTVDDGGLGTEKGRSRADLYPAHYPERG